MLSYHRKVSKLRASLKWFGVSLLGALLFGGLGPTFRAMLPPVPEWIWWVIAGSALIFLGQMSWLAFKIYANLLNAAKHPEVSSDSSAPSGFEELSVEFDQKTGKTKAKARRAAQPGG